MKVQYDYVDEEGNVLKTCICNMPVDNNTGFSRLPVDEHNFQCYKCDNVFIDLPGYAQCPKCTSLYSKDLDYGF